MRIRGLIFAATLLAALTGTLYWSNHHKASENVQAATASSPKILALIESDVTRIDLKKKDAAELMLAKDSNGKWQITAPQQLAADQSAVSNVLSTLASLSSERVVEEKANSLDQFGLSSPTLEVDVAGKNNDMHKLLVGDDTPTGSGAFAKLENDPRVFTIASYTKNSIDKGLNDLRDKRLLTIEPDKVSRLDVESNRQDIEFGRNKDQWQILKPKPLRADSFQVDELVRKLADAKMDLASDDQKKAASTFAAAKSIATAKLTTDSGVQQLELRKSKDDYYAKSNVVSGVYKVGSDIAQAVNKKLDDFRNKKLFDFGYSDPEKIEIHDGSNNYFLTKTGDDWWSGDGKKLDVSSVQAVIDKTRDLQATKFADSGFVTPTTEISVTSDGGKRLEKVLISKHGDEYIAERQNEPPLYVLDSTAVEALQKSASELKPAVASQKK